MPIPDDFRIEVNNDKFIIGKDFFDDLEINPTPIDKFFYFSKKGNKSLVKNFILREGQLVDYVCKVTLIESDGEFTPRLLFSVRSKKGIIQSKTGINTTIKANISLDQCHENFWRLISFLLSLKEIKVPNEKFSLISQDEGEIVSALKGRNVESIKNIIKKLSTFEGVSLTERDINLLLGRREKLNEFKTSLTTHGADENWWQNYFESNKWVFGYGLNYQILRHEQSQPNYGGTRLDGKGGQKGDYLTSTLGDLNFTVLVEIKTPNSPLLHGDKEIRSGSCGLSRGVVDAVTQIQANIDMWDKQGSRQPDNVDILEKEKIFTVQPKGIIIIGTLRFLDTRSKRETFQRFRKSLHGIDILTFDELLERAQYIVEEQKEKGE